MPMLRHERELTIQQMIAELNQEQNEAGKQRILTEWRVRLAKEPTLLRPYQIDKIMREVRRRLGGASR
jgi:hypothetical protein